MFGNCNHCCFCCGHPFTMLGVSLFISCKNKIQCVCVCVKKKISKCLEGETSVECWAHSRPLVPQALAALAVSFQFWSLQDHEIAENSAGFSASKQPSSAQFLGLYCFFS